MVRLLFVIYAAVEIAALWAVSAAIGFGWAVLLVMLGSALGIVAFGSQSRRLFTSLAATRPGRGGASSPSGPAGVGRAVADGSISMLGVGLLLVPGLVTSALGLLFLFPPTRIVLRPLVLRAGLGRFGSAAAGMASRGPAASSASSSPGPHGARVVDGEVVEPDPARHHYQDAEAARSGGPSSGTRRASGNTQCSDETLLPAVLPPAAGPDAHL